MLKGSELIGVIGIHRQEVRPFTYKQTELISNFAAQAVIAIENARLLNELRRRTDDLSQRTTDLTEALEQQTATSEVLKVISGSPSDLQPVFEAMLDNATRICQASLGTMVLYENGGFRHVALHGAPAAYAELRAREPVVIPKPAQGLGRLLRTKQVVHIADIFSEPPEARGGLAELAGARTLLIVPMLKEQELVGSLGIYRQEMKPFTDKQIALVQNFAAQAVIASRTRGCSMNSSNRWSDKPPPPKCSKSFQPHPAILCRCLQLCWRRPLASAMPSLAPSIFANKTDFAS